MVATSTSGAHPLNAPTRTGLLSLDQLTTSGSWTTSTTESRWGSASCTYEVPQHLNWHRYYDPVTGRYLQPEPMLADPGWVVGRIGSGMSAPVYAYAGNNPIMFTDPDGREIQLKDLRAEQLFAQAIQDGTGLKWVNYLESSPNLYRIYGSATPSGALGIAGNAPGETAYEGKGRIEISGSRKPSTVGREGLDLRLFDSRVAAYGINPLANMMHEVGHAIMFDAARTGRPGYPIELEIYFKYTLPGREHGLESAGGPFSPHGQDGGFVEGWFEGTP